MSCGRCCAAEPCLRPTLRLDIFVEIAYHTRRFRSSRAKHAHCPVMVVRAKDNLPSRPPGRLGARRVFSQEV